MAYDFSKPTISRITRDLAGKTILIYGTNRTGKTYQVTRLPRPCYLAFEAGLNGCDGVPFFNMMEWADYVSFVKWASNPQTRDTARQLYQTIILDEVSVMGQMCADYICIKNDVTKLSDVAYGALYKEMEAEFGRYLDLLTKCGFTVVAIAHDGGIKKITDPLTGAVHEIQYPAGDNRIVAKICNLFDIIAYAYMPGVDAEGKPLKSALYFNGYGVFHAGSRYKEIVDKLDEFTAEGLVQAVADAIEKAERVNNAASVTYEEQVKLHERPKEESFETLQERIRDYYQKLSEADRTDEYFRVVENVLGKGKIASNASREQAQLLRIIISDLENLI